MQQKWSRDGSIYLMLLKYLRPFHHGYEGLIILCVHEHIKNPFQRLVGFHAV